MTNDKSINKAFQILGELMNEDCFDFFEVANSSFDERKDYLRQMIFAYFASGEVQLGGIIKREDNEFEVGASKKTVENIDNFFKNEELVADIILLMDEDVYDEYLNEINN